MNKAIRTLWVTELQSGLPTEDNSLKSFNGFSALGVLVDLYIRDTGLGKWEHRVQVNETVSAETPCYRLVPIDHDIKSDPFPDTFENSDIQFTGLRDRVVNDVETMLLPQVVVEWAELEDNEATLKPGSTVASHKGNHLSAAYAIERYL